MKGALELIRALADADLQWSFVVVISQHRVETYHGIVDTKGIQFAVRDDEIDEWRRGRLCLPTTAQWLAQQKYTNHSKWTVTLLRPGARSVELNEGLYPNIDFDEMIQVLTDVERWFHIKTPLDQWWPIERQERRNWSREALCFHKFLPELIPLVLDYIWVIQSKDVK
jgi:hypothetical protein